MSEGYKTPDSKRAASKRYKDKNREKMRKQNLQYYHDHKEIMNARALKYYHDNKDKDNKKQYRQEYYDKNREALNDKNNRAMIKKNAVSRETAFNHRREWTPEEDTILIKLKKQGKPQKEIAEMLGRTIGSINIRLVKLRKADSFNGIPHDDI